MPITDTKIAGKNFTSPAVTVFVILLLMSIKIHCLAQEPTPGCVLNNIVKTIKHSAELGQRANKWSQEKQELLDQLRELELKNQWTKFQIERHNTWIEDENRSVFLLQDRLAEIEKVHIALDPLIEVLYTQLETIITNDLPFLNDERNRRLSILRQELDKTNADMGHRLGRLYEAMQVEALYGHSVDARQIVATVDGAKRKVTIFRLGRIALIRISEDNELVQRYDRKLEKWITIRAENAREIRKAIDIARKKRVTSVVELPIGTFPSLVSCEEYGTGNTRWGNP